jgi:hypothetical protein
MKLENLMRALFDIASNCGDFIMFLWAIFPFSKKREFETKYSFIKTVSCKMAKTHHQKTL